MTAPVETPSPDPRLSEAWRDVSNVLEPRALAFYAASPATVSLIGLVQLSNAISLKRLADTLEGAPAPGGQYSLVEWVGRFVEGRS